MAHSCVLPLPLFFTSSPSSLFILLFLSLFFAHLLRLPFSSSLFVPYRHPPSLSLFFVPLHGPSLTLVLLFVVLLMYFCVGHEIHRLTLSIFFVLLRPSSLSPCSSLFFVLLLHPSPLSLFLALLLRPSSSSTFFVLLLFVALLLVDFSDGCDSRGTMAMRSIVLGNLRFHENFPIRFLVANVPLNNPI